MFIFRWLIAHRELPITCKQNTCQILQEQKKGNTKDVFFSEIINVTRYINLSTSLRISPSLLFSIWLISDRLFDLLYSCRRKSTVSRAFSLSTAGISAAVLALVDSSSKFPPNNHTFLPACHLRSLQNFPDSPFFPCIFLPQTHLLCSIPAFFPLRTRECRMAGRDNLSLEAATCLRDTISFLLMWLHYHTKFTLSLYFLIFIFFFDVHVYCVLHGRNR